MTPTEHEWLEFNAWRLTMLQAGLETYPPTAPPDLRGGTFWAVGELKRHAQALARLEAKPPVDVKALAAALAADQAFIAAIAAGVAAALPHPLTYEQTVDAVNEAEDR